MSQSLFRDLPSPSGANHPEVKRRKVEDQTASLAGQVEDISSTAFKEQSEKGKISGHEPPGAAAQQEQAQPSPDAIVAALSKIATHIADQKKFAKASSLLRQLLQDKKVNAESHGHLIFRALSRSVRNPAAGLEVADALELQRLFTESSKYSSLFTGPQRDALEVYGLRGALRSQMLTTDDSFTFNKAVSRVKAAVDALPNYSEQEADQPTVDALDGDETPTAAVLEALKRQMLLDCMETGKTVYTRPWARTSIDVLADHFRQHLHSFAPTEQTRIADMIAFVKEQRAIRKQGPSAKEINRDTTSFERARAAWSHATVSHRGKVGAGGDHKSENWLG